MADAGAAARALAARVLDRVRRGTRLDEALKDADVPADELPRVRALATSAVRWLLPNQWLLGRLMDKPLRRKESLTESLMLVALQELKEQRQPDYAIVSSAVNATRQLRARHLSRLVNGCLRRFSRERDELLAALAKETEVASASPAWLYDAWRNQWPGQLTQLVEAANGRGPMWLRVSRRQTRAADWLAASGLAGRTDDAFPDAVLLDEPQAVDALPGFAAGEVSVQDAGAQVAAALLAPKAGMRILDACAAPGGKTGHLLEWVDGDADLTALDMSPERLQRVKENLDRLGLSAELVAADAADTPAWWNGEPYDCVLADVPCSATGVIRRHPDIRLLRRAEDIPGFARQQAEMLDALAAVVAPGGHLLYCTCSVLDQENAAVASAFLERHPEFAAVIPDESLTEGAIASGPGWQWLPETGATDGFYYALMTRKASATE